MSTNIPRREEVPNGTGTLLLLSRRGANQGLRKLASPCYLASMKTKNQQPKRGDFSRGELRTRASLEDCDSTAPILDNSKRVPPRASRRGHSDGSATNAISVNVGDELVEEIAHRAAELLAEQAAAPNSDGWLRGAEKIAAYLDCPRSRVYALNSAKRIPVHHDGSALIARRSELDKWLLRGGGRRP